MRTEDIIRKTSAEAHADQPGGDEENASRWSTSRRTQNRWGNEGPPQMREAQLYLLNSPNPFRALTTLKVAAVQASLRTKPISEVIDLYRDLVPRDKEKGAADTKHDLCRATGWLDRSLSSEEDAAVDIQKAACERIFAEEGLSIAEVLG